MRSPSPAAVQAVGRGRRLSAKGSVSHGQGSAQHPAFRKQPPIFYAGDELHVIKQRRLQETLGGFGPRCPPLLQGRGGALHHGFLCEGLPSLHGARVRRAGGEGTPPAVGYVSGSDDLRIRFKSDIEDARRLPALAGWAAVIGGMISDYGLGRARIGTDLMPFMVYEGLKRQFPAVTFSDAGGHLVATDGGQTSGRDRADP